MGIGFCCGACKSKKGNHGPRCEKKPDPNQKQTVPNKPTNSSCKNNCGFKNHSTQGHGFCCGACKSKKGNHGPWCEKKPDPIDKKVAPTNKSCKNKCKNNCGFKNHSTMGIG